MSIGLWRCAHGDAPTVTLPVAATVELAPADESVDCNKVIITGNGPITSFGPSQVTIETIEQPGLEDPIEIAITTGVTKYVTFLPTGGNITLVHDATNLSLLGEATRVINRKAFGRYSCDEDNHWVEEAFRYTDLPPHPPPFQRSVSYYPTSATITIPDFATDALVSMAGGGGYAMGTGAAAGAAGCGAYLEKNLTGLVGGHTLTLTIGAGGTVGAQNGGNTVLASGTQTIATLTAGGGGHGNNVAGAGGTATGGDLNIPGGGGNKTDGFEGEYASMSTGGNPWSPMMSARTVNGAFAGQGYGGGALATGDPGSGGDKSANGTPGFCKIDWSGQPVR